MEQTTPYTSMHNVFEYRTISKQAEGLYKDRGSRFVGFAWPVESETEVEGYFQKIRKEHHSARHHCYAYIIGTDDPRYRFNDDGEPSGTAGRPVYGQIVSNELLNILVVVVRYFGGVKLGVSGLIRAYRSAAEDTIRNADIVIRKVEELFSVSFSYEQLDKMMKIVKEEQLTICKHNFDTVCNMEIVLWKKKKNELLKKIETATGVIPERVDC